MLNGVDDLAQRAVCDAHHLRCVGIWRTILPATARALLLLVRVVRHLKIERPARLRLPRHELNALGRDGERLLRVGAGHVLRAAVSIRAVVFVEAMLRRTFAAHVPLAEVRGRVASALQQLADSRGAGWQLQHGVRRDDAGQHRFVTLAVAHERHVQRRRAAPGEQRRPRRRAARRRRVAVRETHARRRESLQVRGLERRAFRGGIAVIHLHGGTRPPRALAVDDDEVGALRRRGGSGKSKSSQPSGHGCENTGRGLHSV